MIDAGYGSERGYSPGGDALLILFLNHDYTDEDEEDDFKVFFSSCSVKSWFKKILNYFVAHPLDVNVKRFLFVLS